MNKIIVFFVKYYWAYIKPHVDMYEINIQIKKLKFIGDKVIFKGAGEIFHPWNISIGNHVQIGTNCFLMGIGGIEIGDGTIISRNVCIHSGNHDFKSSEMIPYNSSYLKGKITIGKGVWIGQNVNILPGVTIGDGAIIGMGTTVSKDVPKYAIVVGAGQRIIGERDKDFFEEGLSSENYYGKEY